MNDDLDLEYRLTIAARVAEECDCVRYLIRRRPVLIPAVLEQARKDDADPVEVFARFARRLHARHEDDQDEVSDVRRIAGRFAALMALVNPTPEEPPA